MAVVDEASIELVQRGVAGRDEAPRHARRRSGARVETRFFERNEVLRAGVTGIFYAEVERGRTVKKGARLGRITDFHGKTIEEVLAPFDGQILYVIGTPPITKGRAGGGDLRAR